MAKLRAFAGPLGWLTSIIWHARPWASMIWGAVTEAENRVSKRARSRKNLVFTVQVSQALEVLDRMASREELKATFHHTPQGPKVSIQTDASVWGMGGGPVGPQWTASMVGRSDPRRGPGVVGGPVGRSSMAIRMGADRHRAKFKGLPPVGERAGSGLLGRQHRCVANCPQPKDISTRYGSVGCRACGAPSHRGHADCLWEAPQVS